MNRRKFMSYAAGLIIGSSALSAAAAWNYEAGMIKKDLAAGKTVLVDYYASWCGTCATQKRVMARLRAENPQYDDKIKFIKVDWDEFANHTVATSRKVVRQSTLVLLRGNQELGRVVAGTNKQQLKALLDKAL